MKLVNLENVHLHKHSCIQSVLLALLLKLKTFQFLTVVLSLHNQTFSFASISTVLGKRNSVYKKWKLDEWTKKWIAAAAIEHIECTPRSCRKWMVEREYRMNLERFSIKNWWLSITCSISQTIRSLLEIASARCTITKDAVIKFHFSEYSREISFNYKNIKERKYLSKF